VASIGSTSSAHESVLCAVEIAEEAFVERQPGTQNGGYHQLVGGFLANARAERGLDFNIGIIQAFRDFVSHYLSDAPQVGSEAQRVVLDIHVPQLTHIAAHQRRPVGKIYNFHHNMIDSGIHIDTIKRATKLVIFCRQAKKRPFHLWKNHYDH